MSYFTDQLQQLVDTYRQTCKQQGFQPNLTIANIPGVSDPLIVDVIPDGVSWIVTFRSGDRILVDHYCCDPQSFLDNLYTNIVACIRALKSPQVKPS